MNAPYEGKRYALKYSGRQERGWEPRTTYFKSWDDLHEIPRTTEDRYAAKTWATAEAAERNARNLGIRYTVVEVFL